MKDVRSFTCHTSSTQHDRRLPFGRGAVDQWRRLLGLPDGGGRRAQSFTSKRITHFGVGPEGTFNRVVDRNQPPTTLSRAELKDLLGVRRRTANVLDRPESDRFATGRAVGADNLTNAAGFTGQAFSTDGRRGRRSGNPRGDVRRSLRISHS